MFGLKKKKKEKNKYSGSYVVKDVDNIISIAQSYDISWKELAKVNDIDPPYILIAGETISVPGEDDKVDEKEVAQVSNVKISGHVKKQSNMKNAQAQQSSNVVTGDIKANMQVSQKPTVSNSVEGSLQQKDVMPSTKKNARKITYASPKNMLHKPSAEPTAQAIDIEWMQNDETAYSEEIQLQRKKLNTRFIVISILIIAVVGLVVWWGFTWFLNQGDNENVSVQTLIEENKNMKKDESKEVVPNDKVETVEENEKKSEYLVMEGGEDMSEMEDGKNELEEEKDGENSEQQKENIIPAGEITVQVLNAGAQIGAAGDVTKIFTKEGYKTNTAQNASNNYNNVVIYYSSDKKSNLEDIAKKVVDKYGTQKHEESEEVTKRYNADFVIVLGS